MAIKIALAGNPNTGKTTLFNALTGSNQFVGNWPGVTVEKKEGRLKNGKGVTVTDLPGIYSLSPYTPEEIIARNYLIEESPDAILNIIDGTNLERNLYLTTQLLELGIPVVCAVNMVDIIKKNGDKLDIKKLSENLGCKVVVISALKGEGIDEAAKAAIEAAKSGKAPETKHAFSESVESALEELSILIKGVVPEKSRRWYAVKLFERDEIVAQTVKISSDKAESIISAVETELDDDAQSIITNERYTYIGGVIKSCFKKKNAGALTASDKIDRIVTNRFLGLPIFAAVMFVVYFVSMVTVGAFATDWANDGLFGDGWHLFSIGSGEYEQAAEEYGDTDAIIEGFIEYANESGIDTAALEEALGSEADGYSHEMVVSELNAFAQNFTERDVITITLQDEETLETEDVEITGTDLVSAVGLYEKYGGEPAPAEYGVWIPGIPVLIEGGLDAIGCADWLKGLILDGIVAGVGAVLGFVPQMLVLFIFLAFLEACGYMARIAFVMDRIFRKFGLSGKSFIPMLIGTGCGVPGIMASRTIENERDRRMTVMTTTFIPCGAKMPFIAMIAGAIFGGSAWIATSAYFIGVAAIIISGIILKKTRMFAGEPAPFVMELPAYHLPTVGNVLRSMWERGWSFIKKAGTIILLSTILVWFTSFFGFVDGSFTMLDETQIEHSILAFIGNGIAWIFIPLGWGEWQSAVAAVTGLVAKENIVSTMGILYGGTEAYANMTAVFTAASGMSFLIFNLLCAPCFAAIGAIKREMNSAKWTWFAIGYECGFAYAVSLCVYQIGALVSGSGNVIGVIAAAVIILTMVYLLFRPQRGGVKTQRRTVNS
ncbi:MAG: ferrous iron transporter B [Oscillospiraceae bacterium]|nr:ferrous iron transporter B [Oscillospiraceae bacterium]